MSFISVFNNLDQASNHYQTAALRVDFSAQSSAYDTVFSVRLCTNHPFQPGLYIIIRILTSKLNTKHK